MKFDASAIPGARLSEDELKMKTQAAEAVETALREALQSGDVDAFVHHLDGRIFRIPNCYWGSFHDYRPLTGEGFLSDQSHGPLAQILNGCGVFLDKVKADAKWPMQRSRVAEPIERKSPGPARHPIVVQAIAQVTSSFVAAGYKQSLQPGEYQAIKDALESAISKMSGWKLTRSDRSLRNYADEIKQALPDS